MFRIFLSAILVWLTFDWASSVVRMTQTDNIYLIDSLATHASNNAWLMLIVAVIMVIDYRWERNND